MSEHSRRPSARCPCCGEPLYVTRLSARRYEAQCSLVFCTWRAAWTGPSKYGHPMPPAAIDAGTAAGLREMAACRRRLLGKLERARVGLEHSC
jgi:hypothetical protein